MQLNPKLLECLFGHHDYSKELTRDKHGRSVHLCKICKMRGYWKSGEGRETWYDYDTKGNRVHIKCSDGEEYWFDKKGNLTHKKWSSGDEIWWTYDKWGNLISSKDTRGCSVGLKIGGTQIHKEDNK